MEKLTTLVAHQGNRQTRKGRNTRAPTKGVGNTHSGEAFVLHTEQKQRNALPVDALEMRKKVVCVSHMVPQLHVVPRKVVVSKRNRVVYALDMEPKPLDALLLDVLTKPKKGGCAFLMELKQRVALLENAPKVQ
jgi:hypothetical protein